MALLHVQDLCTELLTETRILNAVESVSLTVDEGETVTIIGESGCGKSTLAQSIMRLLPSGVARHTGSVYFEGQDLMAARGRDLLAIRGRAMSMVFQDPMSALNPVRSIGQQMIETLRLHTGADRADARRRSVEMLERVAIPDPERQLRSYPHQLSGGMLQRVLIAMAVASQPRLLIADEPTSALDVTVQASILDLLGEVQERTGMAVLLITHDLGVAAQVSDRVDVMYAGRIVESGPAARVLGDPRMPYTIGLLSCTPSPADGRRSLVPIAGQPPQLDAKPTGCNFAPRCPFVQDECRETSPARRTIAPEHEIECLFDISQEQGFGEPGSRRPHSVATVPGSISTPVVADTQSTASEPL